MIRSTILNKNTDAVKKSKYQIRNEKEAWYKAKLENILATMSDLGKRLNDSSMQIGAYNWLTSLPIKESNYQLNKQQFWDALRIRYNWNIPNLPSECVCGKKFDLNHALSCKKGGFVSLRHNEVRNITAQMLSEVCKDVKIEPGLIKLTGEQLNVQANKNDESRLDVSALGFWSRGQKVFCDVRVFDHNALRYSRTELKKCFQKNEEEKKKSYNERVLQIENATFTPLVFSANGGMGKECSTFYKRLAEMIADKRNIATSEAISFVRTRISFSLLRSMLLCLRGSRSHRVVRNESNADMPTQCI